MWHPSSRDQDHARPGRQCQTLPGTSTSQSRAPGHAQPPFGACQSMNAAHMLYRGWPTCTAPHAQRSWSPRSYNLGVTAGVSATCARAVGHCQTVLLGLSRPHHDSSIFCGLTFGDRTERATIMVCDKMLEGKLVHSLNIQRNGWKGQLRNQK